MLRKVAILAAVLLANPVQAQVVQTTRVYGIVATYADTKPFKRGPETLHEILQKVHDFYAEGSSRAHKLIGEVYPATLELPQTRPTEKCQLPDKAKLSDTLRETGINLNGYDVLALVVPSSKLRCGKGGIRTSFHHREADGTTRTIPLALSWSLKDLYVAHEIIHTHGLGHSNTLACRKVSLAVSCKTTEYGNDWDLMGRRAFQMISAPMRARIGWTEPIVHVVGSATYTIGAATNAGGLPTAVEVVLPFTGDEDTKVQWPLTLWIEYRAPFGFDKRMADKRFVNFATGAMVNLTGIWQSTVGSKTPAIDCPPTSPCLLDMNPQTGTFNDAGLTVGQSWTEPFSGTKITVDSRTETTLTVSVAVAKPAD